MDEIICAMFDHLIIKFGSIVLKSGKTSPIYFDMRILPSYPELLEQVAKAMLSKMHSEQFLGRRLAGLPMSGLPIAIAMGIIGKVPVLYPRSADRGGKMSVEGRWDSGETVIVVDDVLTDGVIKKAQIERIRATGLEVRDLIVVVNRDEGGTQLMEEIRVRVHSLTTMRQIIEVLRTKAQLGNYEYERTLEFLNGSNSV